MHPASTVANWLRRIVGHEGGFTMDPDDPGNWTGGKIGAGKLKGTKYGIAANTYPDVDIAALTLEDAVELYQQDYLRPLQADKYEDGVAYQLLDFAVNSGAGRAIRTLQSLLGVTVDGTVGPETLKALAARSEADVVMLLIAERLTFMTGLRNWPQHGKGWARRIADNLRYAAEDT